MDKDVMKRLLRDAHLPIPKFLAWERRRKTPISYDEAASQLGETIFVKPANLGSSVGVAKARDAAGFERAAAQAFEFDDKIMLEEFVQGREIECAVLGDEDPQASAPGEVIPTHEFYSYEAKYLDENGAALEIPAKLDPEVAEKLTPRDHGFATKRPPIDTHYFDPLSDSTNRFRSRSFPFQAARNGSSIGGWRSSTASWPRAP